MIDRKPPSLIHVHFAGCSLFPPLAAFIDSYAHPISAIINRLYKKEEDMAARVDYVKHGGKVVYVIIASQSGWKYLKTIVAGEQPDGLPGLLWEAQTNFSNLELAC